MTSEPFDPPYTAEDLPELDRRHILVGLGVEWIDSKERAKIAATSSADAGTTQSAPEPSQAATEAHSDDERVRKYAEAVVDPARFVSRTSDGNEWESGIGWTARAVMAVADAELAELRAERDAAQEHVAYHLRDYSLNSDLTGDLAVDMAAYAGRLKIRAEAAEAKVARVEALAATWATLVDVDMADELRDALDGDA